MITPLILGSLPDWVEAIIWGIWLLVVIYWLLGKLPS